MTEIPLVHQGLIVSRETDAAKIMEAVEAAEQKTSAEFVVALEPRCGSYRDVNILFGATLAFAGLLYELFNPWSIHDPDWIPVNMVFMFGLGCLFSTHTRVVHRWFAGRTRQERQVREHGQVLFYQQGISQTRERTGVLVLVAQTEKRIEIVADSGVLKAVDAAEWASLIQTFQPLLANDDCSGAAVSAVEQLGDYLADPLPVADDDIDELSNVPRLH